MQGLGNGKGFYSSARLKFIQRNNWIINEDYIFIDTITAELSDTQLGQLKTSPKISALCDRNFGVGGDGLVFISVEESKIEGDVYRMEMFNADGSEGKTCGNALRCIGNHWLLIRKDYYFRTLLAKITDSSNKIHESKGSYFLN